MIKKQLLAALLAALLATCPLLSTRARVHATGMVTLYGISFPTGTNSCTGPLVAVYGASALQGYIRAMALDYCNSFPPSQQAGAPDVEYAAGGTACTGMDWAADHNDGYNEIGVSTLFVPACTGGSYRPSSSIVDTIVAVNVVESIAQCPGANNLQGSSPHPTSVDVPCKGNGSGTGDATFTAPNNESVQTAQLLWSSALGDYAQAGGTAGNPPTVQQRIPGSGDRATWCQNLYGPGNDQCVGNATNTNTTGTELTAVCGNPYTNPTTSPTAGANAIGYASRAALVLDPRQPPGGVNALAGCGIVQLSGANGYNATCDPSNPQTQNSSNAGTNPESNYTTCNGDLQVAEGNYPAWGYVHLDLNAAEVSAGTNAAAQGLLNFIATDADDVRDFGGMETCQMEFSRSMDGGPYQATTGATC